MCIKSVFFLFGNGIIYFKWLGGIFFDGGFSCKLGLVDFIFFGIGVFIGVGIFVVMGIVVYDVGLGE